MVVDELVRLHALGMVGCCVHEGLQTGAAAAGDGNGGHAQHFRQAVQVDLHPPFMYDVHHIQRHYHRFADLQQLQGQVQAAFQGRCIHDVDNHVHLVPHDKLAGHLLLHGVGSQAIGAGQIHQAQVHVVISNGAFHSLHSDAWPVGHLQIGAGVGVEQGGLPAVGVAHECNGNILCHINPPLYGYGRKCPGRWQSACRAL